MSNSRSSGNQGTSGKKPKAKQPGSLAVATDPKAVAGSDPPPSLAFVYKSTLTLNVLLGAVRIMAVSFWWAVAQGYLFLIWALLGVWQEQWICNRGRRLSTLLTIVILGIGAWFTISFVSASSPLLVAAVTYDSVYPTGTDVSGIEWSDKDSELRINISNPSDDDYLDLDLFIRPYDFIDKISEVSNQNVEILNGDPEVYIDLAMQGANPQKQRVDLSRSFQDYGFRVIEQRLPKHSTVELLVATLHPTKADWATKEGAPQRVFRMKQIGPNKVWSLSPEMPDGFYVRKPVEQVDVTETYRASGNGRVWKKKGTLKPRPGGNPAYLR